MPPVVTRSLNEGLQVAAHSASKRSSIGEQLPRLLLVVDRDYPSNLIGLRERLVLAVNMRIMAFSFKDLI
jgi:hypothetical protein